jgi:endonuclease/exonuclease/phosphatase (EEP) superfamily protein YafD
VSTILLHPPSPRNQLLWEQRNYLLSKVDQQMLQLKGHWFIAGDFNTVPWSRYFLNHNNSCSQQGRNYASWYAVENKLAISLAGLPIDNCIVSQGTRLSGVHTQVIKGSDHHLLSYQLSFSTY